MLPKINPIDKTRTELNRCVGRLDNLLNTYTVNELTEEEIAEATELLSIINQAVDVLPARYRKQSLESGI